MESVEETLSTSSASVTSYKVALLAGASGGLSVDIALFPLDTLKTRLQSEAGFLKSGGFRGIYSGLLSAALGSAPTAALFFVTYESSKTLLKRSGVVPEKYSWVGPMAGACLGEVSACLFRVPVEVVKQRTQAQASATSYSTFQNTLRAEGLAGFYRGYTSTVIREVPFSILQFPLWEYMKSQWAGRTGRPIEAWQSSLCGAASGAIAGAITTPLDVAKTRIMLAEKGSVTARSSIGTVLVSVARERGLPGLFAGLAPRVMCISIGGSIFLGVYEKVKISLTGIL